MASLDDLLGVRAPPSDTGATPAAAGQSHFISTLFNQLVQSTRQSNDLPDADDHRFLTSSSPEYVKASSAVQGRLLNLLGLLSDAITARSEPALQRAKRLGGSHAYSSKKDTLDRFHQLSDTVDTALEAVDLALDEHRGVKRGNTAMNEGGASSARLPRGTNQFNSSSTMLKPQRAFAQLIDNSSRTWIPILKIKPNALKPLVDYEKMRREKEKKGGQKEAHPTTVGGDQMEVDGDGASAATGGVDLAKGAPSPKLSAAMTSHIASLGMSTELKSPVASLYPHPYQFEIENFDYAAVRETQLMPVKEQLYGSLEKVPCLWVDSLGALKDLVVDLESASAIAIDLEHHSFRSYFGLTCLMQISTRKKDYLVDTLALRTDLWRLNTSFTNPSIVKVLHGADSDVIWLQRDFGLYVVNLFDTGQAARVLEFQSFGLAYLLKHFCDVHTDKKYQLADWRIRPLSAEMLLYARMDTHYLLYIYDRLKNDLIQRSTAAQNALSPIRGCTALLAQVLERSRAIALKTYEKEEVNPQQAPLEFAFKMGILLQNDAQSKVLCALFKLRDDLARQEDESVFYLCSNPNLLQIIQHMPSDQAQLEAVCQKPIPPMVRMHAKQVLATIATARAQGSLTSPFLASTLPPMSASPALAAAPSTMAEHPAGLELERAAAGQATPPQKYGKGLFGGGSSQQQQAASGAAPNQFSTPASSAAAMFASLATSTPQQSHHSGWVSQALHDAAPIHPPHASGSSHRVSVGSSSPVMSTDQLYSSANWIQASKNLERSLQSVKNPNPMAHSSAGISVPLFDDSEPAAGLPSAASAQPAKAFQALMSPAPKASPFSMLTSSAEARQQQLDDTRSAMEKAHAALTQAPAYAHVIHALTTPSKVAVDAGLASAMDVDDDSAMLRTPVTGEPTHSFVSPSPMSLQVIPSPANVPTATSATKFTSIAGDVPAVTSEDGHAAASSFGGVGGGSSPLPKSMREIYKISNENRRKKKKVKTTAATAGAKDSGMDGEEEEGSHSAQSSRPGSTGPRGKDGGGKKGAHSTASSSGVDTAADGTNSHEFMKNIGWGNGASPQLVSSVPASQPNSATAFESKRKHSSAPASGTGSLSSSPPLGSAAFQSFDYTHATLPPVNPQSQAYFNPYSDMGRDRLELQAAAGTAGPKDLTQKIFKNHNKLNSHNKSVTMAFEPPRQRGGSASSGLPIPRQANNRR